jgi:cardiolipin synthase
MSWATVYYLSEWVIRLGMLLYVPRRRSPAAARTWLLFIFLFPWPGLVMYTLFGRPRVPRRRIELQAKVSGLIQQTRQWWQEHAAQPAAEVPPELSQAVSLAANLGDFGVCGHNQVELLVDYDGTIDRLVADIAAARSHVHLLYYIFGADGTGRRVADALGHAVQRGVRCRVLMDAIGSRPALRKLAPSMRESGIEVHALMPVGLSRRNSARLDLRNHRKIAVIDGSVGYFGSQNIVAPEFVRGCTNEELAARVTGPLVAQLQAVFLMDRYLETATMLQDLDLFPAPPTGGTSSAQVLPSGPTYPNENAHEIMVSLMYAARERIVITTPYFIPDEPFLLAMRTAVQRGVEVHLVVSYQSNQLLVNLAQKSYYDDLLDAGVRIHLYEGHFLHAKHLSIDAAVALIGSSNMDIRSFALNSEVSVLIYDAAVVTGLREVQERYFAKSHLLSREEWARRPLRTKLVQNIARMADSFL